MPQKTQPKRPQRPPQTQRRRSGRGTALARAPAARGLLSIPHGRRPVSTRSRGRTVGCKEVHVERWNRILAAAAGLAHIIGARVATAQTDPASPDRATTVAVGTETWYTQPWVWIVMGAVLLLALLALASRRRWPRT